MTQHEFESRLNELKITLRTFSEKNNNLSYNTLKRLLDELSWENRYASGRDTIRFLSDSYDGDALLMTVISDFIGMATKRSS